MKNIIEYSKDEYGNNIYIYSTNYYSVIMDEYKNLKLNILKTIKYEPDELLQLEAIYVVNQIIDLKKSSVEYVFLVVFDNTEEIRGVFLISKGDSKHVDVYTKEILIDCLLCQGNRFILIHNHPNNVPEFSETDICNSNFFEQSNSKIFNICDIEYFDDLLITDNDWIASYKNEEGFELSSEYFKRIGE